MKLKLVQKGYEGFTGLFGVTEFKDGVSVNDVPLREARNIAISIKTEYEDGSDPNPAQNLLNSMHNKAGEAPAEVKTPAQPPVDFELGKLEAIADKDGIKGLREIADPLGIKGNSIKELIKNLHAYAVKQRAE